MILTLTILHRRPDPYDPDVQRIATEINGVRVTFDGVPGAAGSPADVAEWVRRTYSDDELRALADAQADMAGDAPGAEYFALRLEDLGADLSPVWIRVLLARLNTVEAAANVSPTTLEGFLDACLTELQRS